ncbi:unnamed protein product [Camellia sinensis]
MSQRKPTYSAEDDGISVSGMKYEDNLGMPIPSSKPYGSSFRELWYHGDSDNEDDLFPASVDLDTSDASFAWPNLWVSQEELAQLRAPWCRALIVKVLGRTIGYSFLIQQMKQLWRLQQFFEAVDVGDGYYMVRFACKEDYLHVLLDGPWVIFGHYLTISKWKLDFRCTSNELPATLVWV